MGKLKASMVNKKRKYKPASSSKVTSRKHFLRFRRGAKAKNYLIVDNSSGQKLETISPLGEGGSSTVYLAAQLLHGNVQIKRAVKFFIYRDDIAQKTINRKSGGISRKDFLNEIVNIAGFNHEHLVKVTDAGMHETAKAVIPFIVYEYIKGPDLREVLNKEKKEYSQTHPALIARNRLLEHPEEILKLLIQIASGLKCLHDKKFFHCDIAPKNIFLKMDENYKAVIGDLGVGRFLEGRGKITVLGSRDYMPPEPQKYLYEDITKERFGDLQPHWDLYAFAKIGIELLTLVPGNEAFSWKEPLRETLLECSNGERNKGISPLLERLTWLLPTNRVLANVPELSTNLATNQKTLMPVEALVTTKRVRQLFKHPALLRLAKVPQITMAYQVFPGAGHSRYEHSLGTMETMRRYLINLVDQGDFLGHLSSDKIETALICALFSSLTRFPFSNVLAEIRGIPAEFWEEFSKTHILDELFQIKNNEKQTLPDLIT